jgi:hypothetical protein
MSISATLGLDEASVHQGGGLLWAVEYDDTKEPYQPHASLAQDEAAAVTTLHCVRAPAADTNVPISFGATGDLNIDIFAETAAAEDKAYSALSANNFTIAALTTARKKGNVVKKKATGDYALTDWKCLGRLQGTTLTDERESSDSFDEMGTLVATFDGDRNIQIESALMQSSKDMIDFLTKEAPSKFFALKYVVGMATKGKQIVVMRKVKLVAKFKAEYKQKTDRLLAVTLKILTVGTNEPYVVYEG